MIISKERKKKAKEEKRGIFILQNQNLYLKEGSNDILRDRVSLVWTSNCSEFQYVAMTKP